MAQALLGAVGGASSPHMDRELRVIEMEYCREMPRQRERERGARPPVCQYCAAIADTSGPGLPLGWTIQSGVRGWTYLCATCTRSNLRSIESRLFERDALGFGMAN
jgi:hypothetical protein